LRDLKLSSDVTTDSPRDFKRMTKTGPETGQKLAGQLGCDHSMFARVIRAAAKLRPAQDFGGAQRCQTLVALC
jgi:hypothetical protein